MKLKDNIYNFYFKPNRYEFDNYDDIYDANWLIIDFSFNYKGQNIVEQNSEFTTFEMLDFIIDVRKALQKSSHRKIKLCSMEPSFQMSLCILGNVNTISISHNFQIDNAFDSISFCLDYTKEELIEFIDNLSNEYINFPFRSIAKECNINVYDKIVKLIKEKYLSLNYIEYTNETKIQFNELFILTISNSYDRNLNNINLSINKKPYKYGLEFITDEIEDIINGKIIVVEYIKSKGFITSSYFKTIYTLDEIKKYRKKKSVLGIYSSKEIFYSTIKFITDDKVYEDGKYNKVNESVYRLFFNDENKERIQIIKKNNSYTYSIEFFEIKNEFEYGNYQKYGIWVPIVSLGDHYYDSYERLLKDIDEYMLPYIEDLNNSKN